MFGCPLQKKSANNNWAQCRFCYFPKGWLQEAPSLRRPRDDQWALGVPWKMPALVPVGEVAAERHGSLSSIQRIKIQVSGIEVRGPYLSETNVFSPENGWLEDTNIVSF